jgi:Flp pilus assembly protein TadD
VMPVRRTVAGLLLLVVAACSSHKPTPSKEDSVRLGDALAEKKEYAQAIAAYRAASQSDPEDGQVRLKLARVYAAVANWGSALREAQGAADLRPTDADAQLFAGQMLLGPGWSIDAAERARAALRQQPENIQALILLGNAGFSCAPPR